MADRHILTLPKCPVLQFWNWVSNISFQNSFSCLMFLWCVSFCVLNTIKKSTIIKSFWDISADTTHFFKNFLFQIISEFSEVVPNWPKIKFENPLQIYFLCRFDLLLIFHQKCVNHKPLKELKGKEIHCSSERTLHLLGQDLKSVSTTARLPSTKTLFFKWSRGEIGGNFYVNLHNLKCLEDIR